MVPSTHATMNRVIVTSPAGVEDAASAVVRAGGRVTDRFDLVRGVAADLPSDAVLAPSYVVAADRPLKLAGEITKRESGLDSKARQTLKQGRPAAEGRGITVAVVDTGVADVSDLKDRVTHVDVSGAPRTDAVQDGYGHGTFVAGLIAGDGLASGGLYGGVAPGAHILDVKVAADDGSTSLVGVLKGLQVAAHQGVDVVNLSMSSGSPLPYQLDPLTLALDELWRRGVVVVVPAGNTGNGSNGTITSPGIDPMLLTVGSIDEQGTAIRSDDVIASSSGQGPAPQGIAKPDLAAAGSHLVSLRAPGSVIDTTYPGSRVGEAYFRGSGTSFATAIASGAAAVLLKQRLELTPNQVKGVLVGTAYRAVGLTDPTLTGAGGMDLAAALADVTNAAGLWSTFQTDYSNDTVPGDPNAWNAFRDAVNSGDPTTAGRTWAELDPAARDWAGRTWAAVPLETRTALEADWAGRTWAGRTWAGRTWANDGDLGWAGRTWAANNWSGRTWAGRTWAGDSSWSGRTWAGDDSWTGRTWAGRTWADSGWSGSTWSAEGWG